MRDFASTPIPRLIDTVQERVQIGNVGVKTAIVDRLREIGAEPGQPIVMADIGVPLIADGCDQHEIVFALYSLEREGVIELMMSNALKLLRPI